MTLVIGVGNTYRSDDGAGPAVANALAARELPGLEAIEHDGEPVGLMQAWEGHERVIVVDAVQSDHPPGTIHRFAIGTDRAAEVPSRASADSSHALGAGEAVELARTLGRLPAQLLLIGITGTSFDHGLGLTARVQLAVDGLVAELARGT